jgi:hypothetical protein
LEFFRSFELYFSEASTIAPEVRTVGVRLLNNNISFLLSRIHTKVDQLPMMALVHSLGDQSSGLPALLQCCFKLGFPAFDYLRQREVQKLESNKKIQLAQARKVSFSCSKFIASTTCKLSCIVLLAECCINVGRASE